MPLVTLRKRAEFLRLRGGRRWSTKWCVVETKPTPATAITTASGGPDSARFGFTITKQVGTAVVRNKLRRRLKAIVAAMAPDMALPGHDYVIVVRPAAAASSFQELADDVTEAFRRVARDGADRSRRHRSGKSVSAAAPRPSKPASGEG